MRDNDFYTFSQLIIREATPLMTDLTPFGILPADLAAAVAASEVYLGGIQNPRGQINERSKALADLETEMANTDALVRDRLDKVMGIYQATNLSLYTGYLGARSIDGTGSQTPPDYEGKLSPGSITLVATIPYLSGRSFEVENTGTTALIFSLSTDPALLNGTPVAVGAGNSFIRKSSVLNTSETAHHLVFQNTDTNVSGSYKIWVIE